MTEHVIDHMYIHVDIQLHKKLYTASGVATQGFSKHSKGTQNLISYYHSMQAYASFTTKDLFLASATYTI